MNRLIIIGNGFDLAHGLPTSYRNFIDDYWGNVIQVCKREYVYKDDFLSLNINIRSIGSQGKYEFINDVKCYKTFEQFTSRNEKYCSQEFGNQFLKMISNKQSIQNWVDIENEYYKQLKTIIRLGSLNSIEKKEQIIKLNTEFEQIKNLLEKYLKEKNLDVFNLDSYQDREGDFYKFQKIISPISMKESNLLEEFHKKDHKEIEDQFEKEKVDAKNQSRLQILNFNYSYTPYRYLNNIKGDVVINCIHGEIGNKTDNKINFGFGDEMDDDYKAIENIDDNEYLRNFKSFLYLQNSNYKQLLDFIEDEKFQIYIMGHSCGLSDRTLLNTVFEHDNCRSIKVFYHQREDGSDNYTEIIQNISRHFNKKKLMREKIVNKTLCKPLPQIQLPRK